MLLLAEGGEEEAGKTFACEIGSYGATRVDKWGNSFEIEKRDVQHVRWDW